MAYEEGTYIQLLVPGQQQGFRRNKNSEIQGGSHRVTVPLDCPMPYMPA
jgi:hypothetical protein